MPDKKTREAKTPDQQLSEIDVQIRNANLRIEELQAHVVKLSVRRKRILIVNPELVEGGTEG